MQKHELLKALEPFDDDANIMIEFDFDDELTEIVSVSAAPDVDEDKDEIVASRTLCIIRA